MDDKKPNDPSKQSQAERMIRIHAAGGAAAAALVPIPYIDPPLLIAVQVNLVRSLANIYEIPFSENIGKSVIGALIGMSVPGVAYSFVKFIPIAGIVITSAVAAASTYAVGRVFVQHFESGGTFLTLDPEKVREHYMNELRGQADARSSYSEEEDYGGIKP